MNTTYDTKNLPVGTPVRYQGTMSEHYGQTGVVLYTGERYGIMTHTGVFLSRVSPFSIIRLLSEEEWLEWEASL